MSSLPQANKLPILKGVVESDVETVTFHNLRQPGGSTPRIGEPNPPAPSGRRDLTRN